MSEPQLISPLLDGYVMGDPISAHHGVRACPAMHLATDKKHIVKIISLPDTQSKLDALLLAGAFSDRDSALAYFKELSEDILEEAALLQKLARNEGFVAFDSWQMIPMDEGETGYDIYLLGDYRPTLDGVLRNNTLTHLQAINLGLDLCAALAVSRRAGYMYSNLRPTNIFICNEREFRIGDLGFLSLDSLQYASLPDKYHSDYTAPEISDAYSALNTTLDTYAVGLILYQAYNDGRLPPAGMQPLPPCHADADLAEIILRACALDPDARWQDPIQMGQALASYMQSHTVNDTPIVPPPVVEEIPEPEVVIEEADTEPSTEDVLAEVDVALSSAPAIPATDVQEAEEVAEEVTLEEVPVQEEAEEAAEEESVTEEAEPSEEVVEIAVEEAAEEEISEEPAKEAEEAIEAEEAEAAEELQESGDEVAQILAQADELIAYQLPDPPVAPEPIDVSLPVEEEPAAEEPAMEEEEPEKEPDIISDEVIPVTSGAFIDPDVLETEEQASKNRKGLLPFGLALSTGALGMVAAILALVLLLIGGSFLFYQNYYIQTIDEMYLTGTENTLIVRLDTSADNSKLYVVCSDTYGNTHRARVVDGIATFTNLKSGTLYTVEVFMDGMHELKGDTEDIFITEASTVINGFYAAEGLDSTSVVLQFVVQGQDYDEWFVTVATEGEEDKTIGFTGHKVTITGLTQGKDYTFTLAAKNGQNVTGTVETTYATKEAAFIEVSLDTSDPTVLKVLWQYDGTLPAGGWLVKYSVSGSAQQVIPTDGNSCEIPMTIPGAHYDIVVAPAGESSILEATATYDAPEAKPFEGFLITAANMEFKMCKTPNKNNWNYRDVATKDYKTTFAVGESAAFVGHLDTKTSKVDDLVTTLYVIYDKNGKLINTGSETMTWDEMWDDRYGEFVIPNMPTEVGDYTVVIYFNDQAAYTQAFTIAAN